MPESISGVHSDSALKRALLFMVLSTASFVLMNAFLKYLNHIPSFELVFFRSFGSFVLATSFMMRHKINILGYHRKLLILRAFIGLTSMSLFFMSIKYLPIGTAVSLRYLAPIFAALFAVVLLKEKLKHIQWLFFAIAFSGVLILRGFDINMNTTGLVLVLVASVLSGLVFVVIRKIGKGEHPLVIVNYFMFMGTVVGGILAINVWKQPQGIEWLFLLFLGVFGYFGQLYMTKAFQIAKTNLVAPLKYIEVIFTICVGIIWFGEIYTFWSFLGLSLIIAALVLNTLVRNNR